MLASSNVFLDFNLPNATTWFYFSLLLAVALFFKFSRFLSIRNLDVVTLFLIAPGLLLIQHARTRLPAKSEPDAILSAQFVAAQLSSQGLGDTDAVWSVMAVAHHPIMRRSSELNWMWVGYLITLLGSGYLFFRCLFDLALVQRPLLSPNLTLGGSIWLAGTLFVCLTAVAFRQPDLVRPVKNAEQTPPKNAIPKKVGSESAPLSLAREVFPDYTWITRSLAVACHLLVVLGLVVIGRWHFNDTAAGVAAATFYLILPYTGLFVGQVHHSWPAAVMVWAVAAHRMPTVAGFFLGIAAATAYFPALAIPLWVSFYWRRGAGRFLLAALLTGSLCLTATGIVLWWHGELEASLRAAFQYGAWQPWMVPPPGTEGFWTGVHWAYRIPLFIAFVAFWLITPFWPMPKNLAQVIALSAALFISVQFWYANQGGVYVLWYLPLLLLLVFRPNLEERRPPLIDPERDWITAWRRRFASLFRWIFRKPERAKVPSA